MEYLTLFYEFFKMGLFSIGGGLATLPFLYKMVENYDWFTEEMLFNMIAISESTPGPMGVNMATYVGFSFGGILVAALTTFALVSPSVVIIIIVSKMLDKFKNNKHVENVFVVIRPAVSGLILSVAIGIVISSLFLDGNIQIKQFILFLALFLINYKFKLHPTFNVLFAGIIGIIF